MTAVPPRKDEFVDEPHDADALTVDRRRAIFKAVVEAQDGGRSVARSA